MDFNQGQTRTGTRDETYDIIAVLYHALQGAENCGIYLNDAGQDPQLRGFFEQALNQQRQLADQAKQLLQGRLQRDQGSSAFAFGQSGQQDPSSSEGSGLSDQTVSATNPNRSNF